MEELIDNIRDCADRYEMGLITKGELVGQLLDAILIHIRKK